MNALCHEMFGGRIQLHHILTCYYRASLLQSSIVINEMSTIIQQHEPVLLHGKGFSTLLDKIDNAFFNAIASSHSDFHCLNEPLLETQQVASLISECEKLLPNHYIMMKCVFKFNKKESDIRTMHLAQTNFYDRRLLHVFMAQSRVLHSHNLQHFGIVGTGACHGRGQLTSGLQHSASSGITSSYATLIRRITPLSMNLENNIKNYYQHITRSLES